MKITKRELKRIIKEEKAKLMEQPDIPDVIGAMGGGKFRPREPNYLKDANDWVETLGQLIDQDMTERNVDLRDEGSELVKALDMLRREYKDEITGPAR